jgi:hypothetical protein
MKGFVRLIALALAGCSASGDSSASDKAAGPNTQSVGTDPIDYEKTIHLDAEALAETGMAEAYEELQRQSGDLGVQWAPMREMWDGQEDGYDGGENYRVEVNGKVYPVFGSAPTADAWALATATFFDVVNSQLSDSPYKFYALMGGNDLHAVRLTREEFEQAQRYHKRPYDRPYVPNRTPPNYGFPQ